MPTNSISINDTSSQPIIEIRTDMLWPHRSELKAWYKEIVVALMQLHSEDRPNDIVTKNTKEVVTWFLEQRNSSHLQPLKEKMTALYDAYCIFLNPRGRSRSRLEQDKHQFLEALGSLCKAYISQPCLVREDAFFIAKLAVLEFLTNLYVSSDSDERFKQVTGYRAETQAVTFPAILSIDVAVPLSRAERVEAQRQAFQALMKEVFHSSEVVENFSSLQGIEQAVVQRNRYFARNVPGFLFGSLCRQQYDVLLRLYTKPMKETLKGTQADVDALDSQLELAKYMVNQASGMAQIECLVFTKQLLQEAVYRYLAHASKHRLVLPAETKIQLLALVELCAMDKASLHARDLVRAARGIRGDFQEYLCGTYFVHDTKDVALMSVAFLKAFDIVWEEPSFAEGNAAYYDEARSAFLNAFSDNGYFWDPDNTVIYRSLSNAQILEKLQKGLSIPTAAPATVLAPN